MSKSNRIKKQILNLFILLMFVLAGLFSVAKGSFSTTIEIDPTGTEISAYVQKKAMFSPLKEPDIVIPKVYQAIMKRKNRYRKSILALFSYRVELKSSNGQFVPITDYSVLRYFFNRKLTNQINDSIQNRIPFTKTFREFHFAFFGVFVIVLCILFIWVDIDYKKQLKQRLQKSRERRKIKMKKTKENPEYIQQSTEPEPEKYKNINDSIIK